LYYNRDTQPDTGLAFVVDRQVTAPTLEDRRSAVRARVLATLRQEYGRIGRPVPVPRLVKLTHTSMQMMVQHLQSLMADGFVSWRRRCGVVPIDKEW
jgi:hypothetical protein